MNLQFEFLTSILNGINKLIYTLCDIIFYFISLLCKLLN